MKATGISRRVDSLGRIVIPKEIRRAMRIHEGDPLEFYMDSGRLCLLKQTAEEIRNHARAISKTIFQITGYPVVMCDIDKAVYGTGEFGKRLTGSNISEALFDKTKTLCTGDLDEYIVNPFAPVEGTEDLAVAVVPILNNARLSFGSILLMQSPEREAPDISVIRVVQTAASVIGALFDE